VRSACTTRAEVSLNILCRGNLYGFDISPVLVPSRLPAPWHTHASDPVCTVLQVPVLLALVYVALWLHQKLTWFHPPQQDSEVAMQVKSSE
jgi:hypothetical protein